MLCAGLSIRSAKKNKINIYGINITKHEKMGINICGKKGVKITIPIQTAMKYYAKSGTTTDIEKKFVTYLEFT